MLQTFVNKHLQDLQGLLPSDGPAKRRGLARVVLEPRAHQVDHLLRHFVGLETRGWWQKARSVGSECLAVVGVEVPFTTARQLALHQNAVLAPHLPVEVLHAQLPPATHMGSKLRVAAQEVAVLQHVQRRVAHGGTQRLQHPPVAGLREPHPLRLPPCQRFTERIAQPALAQFLVVQGHTFVAQRGSEMAHGRQELNDALLAAPHMRAFLAGLAHPDPVPRRIEAVENTGVAVELVTQHHQQMAAMRRHASPLRRRQASEQ